MGTINVFIGGWSHMGQTMDLVGSSPFSSVQQITVPALFMTSSLVQLVNMVILHGGGLTKAEKMMTHAAKPWC